jgi:DNA-binding transcriptional LysR family regulator
MDAFAVVPDIAHCDLRLNSRTVQGLIAECETMDRIDAMRAFVTAVDRGSLASAARGLGHSPATVTRAMALLEGKLGMRLLHRSTRALRLTEFGETYYVTCREVLSALDMAERGAAAEQEQPSGLLTLTAPLRFGQLYVRPILDAFLDANPAVRARLILLDRVVNLVEEGIDVAVRLAHLPDSSQVATRIGEVRRVICASPAYIERHGSPATPAALREHACIMEHYGAELEIWRFASARGRSLFPVSVQPRLVVNSAATAVDSAVEGYGIARIMSYQAAAAVKAGQLVILLPQHEPPPIPVHLVMPSGRSGAAKQRAFVAFAAPRLRQRLTRSGSDTHT